ncbi:PHP domain-containing protein [Clostridium perfringens]
MRYNNYHKHTHYSNLSTQDVIVKPEHYIKRAKELGHTTYFTTEHGWGGNIFEAYELCHQNNLKCIFGVEAYYVDDMYEKDRSNYHIILIAKNELGRKEINKIISKANTDGFYYKQRIDLSCLLSLNPNNVYVTTACVGSRLFKGDDWELMFLIPLYKHFKDNLFLEIQSHNESIQKQFNYKIMQLHNKYGIKLIHGCDSHYILPEDKGNRALYLKGKGMNYGDEDNFMIDYPTYEEIIERYKIQGIIPEDKVKEAIENTLIFDECEGIKLDKEFKIPKVTKGNSTIELQRILANEWKIKSKNVPTERHSEYMKNIYDEFNTIKECGMEDYFILDYYTIKKATEDYGLVLTKSGRGSAVSFLTNKILGLTEVDRLKAPITLYPSRFMTAERILNSRSLPDIDLNMSNREPVIKASKDLLGEDGIYYMIAYKPLQDSSAFRLYCKAKGYHISEYNEVAKNLDQYKDDEVWGKIIEESKIFVGVIESVAPSPCSFLLLDKPISEEIGLIKVGEEICCCLDGYNCDKFKYLKNDFLLVTVYTIIDKVYKELGKPIDSIEEMLDGVKELGTKVWDLYKDGITATLNQADSDFARPLIMKYAPRNLAELSAWVASIRPGFASLLNKFLNREKHTTGVAALDKLLEDSYCLMLYQESIMKFLAWLGIPEKDTYDTIKKISKKKFTQEEIDELEGRLKNGWIKQVGTIDGFKENWQVVNDAVHYSFNASHSLSVAIDSLYGAYLKCKYPLIYMTVVLNIYANDTDKTTKICKELDYFGIKLKTPKFRYSKADYMYDKETNSIYKGIESIKFLNKQCADELYNLRDNEYKTFTDLLYDIQEKVKINSKQMKILILLDFFEEFGKSQRLLKTYDVFSELWNKKQLKKDKLKELNINQNIIRCYAEKETDKIFKEINMCGIIKSIELSLEDKQVSIKQKLRAELEFLGYLQTTIPEIKSDLYYVLEVEEYKNKKSITYYPHLYNIKNGEITKFKLKNFLWFAENPFTTNNIISITKLIKEGKRKLVNGKWTVSKDEFWNIIDAWEVY